MAVVWQFVGAMQNGICEGFKGPLGDDLERDAGPGKQGMNPVQ
jgi:hypothetical protein